MLSLFKFVYWLVLYLKVRWSGGMDSLPSILLPSVRVTCSDGCIWNKITCKYVGRIESERNNKMLTVKLYRHWNPNLRDCVIVLHQIYLLTHTQPLTHTLIDTHTCARGHTHPSCTHTHVRTHTHWLTHTHLTYTHTHTHTYTHTSRRCCLSICPLLH